MSFDEIFDLTAGVYFNFYNICVYHREWFVFFPRIFLSSRVTGACPVTTDLIMRVNVRITTTRYTNNRQCDESFLVCKWLSSEDVGLPTGTVFRRYGRVLVSRPMISLR